jgi:hypothetical protein
VGGRYSWGYEADYLASKVGVVDEGRIESVSGVMTVGSLKLNESVDKAERWIGEKETVK